MKIKNLIELILTKIINWKKYIIITIFFIFFILPIILFIIIALLGLISSNPNYFMEYVGFAFLPLIAAIYGIPILIATIIIIFLIQKFYFK